MPYVALVLIVAACGLLAAAVTIMPVAAWASILLSVVGIAVLIVDGRHNRLRSSGDGLSPGGGYRTPATELQRIGNVDHSVTRGVYRDHSVDPPEEDTDVADFLTVADLHNEVLVVDEHPRYHLRSCSWLHGQRTVPLPVDQARRLGFTPCAACSPDAVLAARYQAGE